ncbi:MAG: hypothetical protein U0P45_01625 [Acidimicrobiales bacterium]
MDHEPEAGAPEPDEPAAPDEPVGEAPEAPDEPPPFGPPIHRLRDLDRRGRLVALGLGLLLVLVPLLAAAANHGRWIPQGDDALIELRARDVGTGRNPLVGQPSTSGSYGQQAENVAHPGPIGFQVLSLTVRLLGPTSGVLLATAAVSAASMVAVAWLLFRHLGARGGAAGAILVSLAAFSAGAAGLTDPLSSNFGRLPLLAAAVGVWALACGDLKVAPLAVAFWSFAAQQHLSVLPASVVLAGFGALAAGWWVARSPREHRVRALAWVGGAILVGLVLWSPVLYQQLTGHPGNLTALREYSQDSTKEDLGLRSAVGQVANVLGPRPFLGRSTPTGWDLVQHRSTPLVALTFLVVAAILLAGAWWQRQDRKLSMAAAMVGVLIVAGLVTGMNVPASTEQGRLNFFHWAFALSFFELLVIGWLLARLAPVVLPKLTHGRHVTAVVVAAVVVFVVALVPVVAPRPSDRLYQPVPASSYRSLVHQVLSSPAVRTAPGPMLVLVNGSDSFVQAGDTVGTRLTVAGKPVVFPPFSKGFVHPDRLADLCTVPSALVLTLHLPGVTDPPGRQVASVDGSPGLDRAALARLVRQAKAADRVDLGADLKATLESLPGDQGALVGASMVLRLRDRPQAVLLTRSNLDLLIDHPIASPALDPDDLRALRSSLPSAAKGVVATEVTAHLLDRDELLQLHPEYAQGC